MRQLQQMLLSFGDDPQQQKRYEVLALKQQQLQEPTDQHPVGVRIQEQTQVVFVEDVAAVQVAFGYYLHQGWMLFF